MTKPRLLDLFCGAGGMARGYQEAGFYVIGVDIKPQPRYAGDEFIHRDAFEILEYAIEHAPFWNLSAIHASPPCQGYSVLSAMHPGREWPLLIEACRERLKTSGLPYVIENVEAAPLADGWSLFGDHGIVLCGSSFGLGARGRYLRRHRRFESNVQLRGLPCRHVGEAIGVYGHGGHSGQHRMAYADEAREALGIDWMNRDEMCQAIPPAYASFVGEQLLNAIERAA